MSAFVRPLCNSPGISIMVWILLQQHRGCICSLFICTLNINLSVCSCGEAKGSLKHNRKGKCCNKWSDTHWWISSVNTDRNLRAVRVVWVCRPSSLSHPLCSRTFCPTKPAKSLHTQKNRQFFFEPEENFWMVMVSCKLMCTSPSQYLVFVQSLSPSF